mgnify:CR=1 FL=1
MDKKIVMYSTEWCGDCKIAKRFFQQHNMEYKEIDIDNDEQSAQKVIELSGGRRVVPTFFIQHSKHKSTILHNPPLSMLAEELGVNY